MFPPSQGLQLDIEAISGICGSISIACWVVVFSPQIIENFKRGSADGLSVLFIVVWLAGDVFNILGAVLQGVLPTMVSVIHIHMRTCTSESSCNLTLDHSCCLLHSSRHRAPRSMLLLQRLHSLRHRRQARRPLPISRDSHRARSPPPPRR